ncbi:carbohydrate ABC transporter substrate-binding protein (CUT1 family) [Sediminihabitans luteus]|uniref:Carbohydrate ABC transporter substrate-binding protein (CUT1 family) n=1 Tax=Sediminihabitans luteus TaxID=1138585 RepID=A0A2M9CZW5_9CELL|nr:sugar ABC transporter substrate-binding protein [Sediminihabitans luteus]PJJ77437.1 carbohydrate ABC transporter substrate-binding protein (CUT1 family) [Sediminihabitans luteus]GII98330.1 sugar ABC transporter substrate-binding protein [Sediminihabitans luteus]
MKTRNKLTMALGVTTVFALALSGCSSSDDSGSGGDAAAVSTDEDITISLAWWGNDDRAAKYEQAVDLFEKAHPNITVQTQFQAWDDYWTARNTEAAGKALPDVMQMDLSYLRQYAATGQLGDLSAQEGVNLDVSGLDESLLESGAIDGKQYAIPTSTNTLALFYNADITDALGMEPPADGYTWDEFDQWFLDVAKAGASEDPAVYGGADYAVTFWFFLQWFMQSGEQPFTEDGQLNFTQDDMKEWLNSTADLRDAKAVYPVEKAKQLEPLTGFTTNEAAAEVSWDNFLAGYVADSGTENIEMLPIPAGDDGQQHLFYKPSMLLAPSSSSEHPDAAAALIDFLINDPEVGTIFGTSKGVPAVAAQRDAMDVEAGSIDEKVVAYEDSVADIVTESAPIPVQGFGAIEAEFKRLGEELQYGNITVDEFVEQWWANAEQNIPQS